MSFLFKALKPCVVTIVTVLASLILATIDDTNAKS